LRREKVGLVGIFIYIGCLHMEPDVGVRGLGATDAFLKLIIVGRGTASNSKGKRTGTNRVGGTNAR